MARPLRLQYPDAVYHVTCRGNEQKDIFRDNGDRKLFLQYLSQSLSTYAVKLYSYVLMSNHFHLLLETPLGNLGEFMRQFNISYTGYFNRRHRRVGHLYQGRYKSILVDKDAYLSLLSRYIHLNPIRTRTLAKASPREKIQYLNHYSWSSLHGYLEKRNRDPFVEYGVVLGEYGGDTGRGRHGYQKALYGDIALGLEIKGKIIGQSLLGGEEFITWVSRTFLKGEQDRESPSLREIRKYRVKETVLNIIKGTTGKSIEEIREEKGAIRQVAMELLYRVGGLKGHEIGRLLGIGYTSVSQERRRLRERLRNDRNLQALFTRLAAKCNE
jgi:REP element-mobilizing transposase RayT